MSRGAGVSPAFVARAEPGKTAGEKPAPRKTRESSIQIAVSNNGNRC
jgi:hypothetical protein